MTIKKQFKGRAAVAAAYIAPDRPLAWYLYGLDEAAKDQLDQQHCAIVQRRGLGRGRGWGIFATKKGAHIPGAGDGMRLSGTQPTAHWQLPMSKYVDGDARDPLPPTHSILYCLLYCWQVARSLPPSATHDRVDGDARDPSPRLQDVHHQGQLPAPQGPLQRPLRPGERCLEGQIGGWSATRARG